MTAMRGLGSAFHWTRAGQILVENSHASINPSDYKVPGMGLGGRAMTTFPKTVGMDLVGIVREVGSGVSIVSLNDLVLVRLDPTKAAGSLSEFVVASKDQYALLESHVNHASAAAAVTVGLTAYQTIKPYVKEGDKIFINEGSGGVGTASIQVAKLLGCHVTVSCSTPRVQMCQSLGADKIIDYKTTDVVTALKKGGRRFSLVVDNVGTSPPNLHVPAQDFLLKDGVFVLLSVETSFSGLRQAAIALFQPAIFGSARNKVVLYLTKNNHDDISQLAQWLNEGKLNTIVDNVYNFGQVKDAFTRLKSGKAAGKFVVKVGDK